ncbi:MAG: slipin family protein [Bdellovibrionota bacterium]
MALFETVQVGDGELALLFKEKRFQRILTPGRYTLFNPAGRYQVRSISLQQPEFTDPLGEILLEQYPAQLSEHLTLIAMGASEVGLVYFDDALVDILPPGKRILYWKQAKKIRVERVDLETSIEISKPLQTVLRRSGPMRTGQSWLAANILLVDVLNQHVGLLSVNGAIERQLGPGSYAFWKAGKNVSVQIIDQRLQVLDVQGQEILSKDKVSLRLNVTASYHVEDAFVAVSKSSDFKTFLYNSLQFAIRETVGTRTLDDLLTNKEAVSANILSYAKDAVKSIGVDVDQLGVKDIILPGDMRTIFNQVVEAEKIAEANLIRRREETAATRSLHNTAKMMENNPTLLRLKELEVLETVTQKIERFTVFGGLDTILKDLVQLKARTE